MQARRRHNLEKICNNTRRKKNASMVSPETIPICLSWLLSDSELKKIDSLTSGCPAMSFEEGTLEKWNSIGIRTNRINREQAIMIITETMARRMEHDIAQMEADGEVFDWHYFEENFAYHFRQVAYILHLENCNYSYQETIAHLIVYWKYGNSLQYWDNRLE